MQRFAIVIGDNRASTPVLNGVNVDVQNMEAFLRSPRGGAWNDDEILLWPVPELEAVRTELKRARSTYDYLLIYFAGHGENDGRSYVWLNARQAIYVDELAEVSPYARAQRVTVISDACRKFVHMPEDPPLKGASGPGSDVGGVAATTPAYRQYRASCRDAFSGWLQAAPPGTLTAYSCSRGEKAGDTPLGGVYSRKLLRRARFWADGEADGAYARQGSSLAGLGAAVHADVTSSTKGMQTPVLCFTANGNEAPRFPFVVA